jgi:hypothetical protein
MNGIMQGMQMEVASWDRGEQLVAEVFAFEHPAAAQHITLWQGPDPSRLSIERIELWFAGSVTRCAGGRFPRGTARDTVRRHQLSVVSMT